MIHVTHNCYNWWSRYSFYNITVHCNLFQCIIIIILVIILTIIITTVITC